MFKIKEVASKCFFVKTDKEEHPSYRRDENSVMWQNLIGESWESVYFGEKELEQAFQEFIN